MRNLSRTMIGLALGAAIIVPATAQAQDRVRDRGGERGFTFQRGGQDRGAMMNGDARREAIQQAREANRAVERPSPAPTAPVATPDSRRQWQRGGADRGVGAPERQRSWDRGGDSQRNVASTPTPPQQRNWNRDQRNDRTERVDRADPSDRNWNRDRDDNRNERWSSDRRDWNRDGRDDRNWNRDGRDNRNWDRSWTSDRNRWDNDRRGGRWDRDWRKDRRYDWHAYRDRNRNIYRLPRYEAPRWGYSYRRWSPGYRWDSWYYSPSYWIADPWYYRLPPAYGDYRWVRYYDDAVLVDIRSGEIIDIIYSFFF